jgi:ubiquinone/menaquinone biosynthesis C-methylase UbiE
MVKNENATIRNMRKDIVGGAKGRILEVGCGTGANFSYYGDTASEIIATDPDYYMLERARKRAAQAGHTIEIKQAPAEELPFEDASFDTVVCTSTMCTVRDPHKALSEVRRVLKPEGEYRFFEHVRYENAFGAFWQDMITPVWRWVAAGCHPNRDVVSFVREAGFEFERLELTKPHPPIPPMVFVRPHIKGVARPA